jgi:hypothetical protein
VISKEVLMVRAAFAGVLVLTFLSVDVQARNEMLGGGRYAAYHQLPWTRLRAEFSNGVAVGTVAGTAAQDHMRGKLGQKCRLERRQGGAIPEC